ISAAIAPALPEARKHLVDALERPALRRGEAGNHEIFLDVEAAEEAPLLVHELHAGLRHGVALAARQVDAAELHRAGPWRHDAHQALQGRALAGAVAAEKGHDLVALDPHGDVEEDVGIPVIGVERVDLEQAHASITPCTPPR